jgi:hypothetical protein
MRFHAAQCKCGDPGAFKALYKSFYAAAGKTFFNQWFRLRRQRINNRFDRWAETLWILLCGKDWHAHDAECPDQPDRSGDYGVERGNRRPEFFLNIDYKEAGGVLFRSVNNRLRHGASLLALEIAIVLLLENLLDENTLKKEIFFPDKKRE